MFHKFDDSIKFTLVCPEEYNGKQISLLWFHSVLKYFEPIEDFTVLPCLLELLNKGKIIILSFRTFDSERHEIPINNFMPTFVEITFAPGHRELFSAVFYDKEL